MNLCLGEIIMSPVGSGYYYWLEDVGATKFSRSTQQRIHVFNKVINTDPSCLVDFSYLKEKYEKTMMKATELGFAKDYILVVFHAYNNLLSIESDEMPVNCVIIDSDAIERSCK